MTTHAGRPNPHDSTLCIPGVSPCRGGYVGAHTPTGITARRRRDRRAEQRAQAEAAKADLLGQAEALAAEVPTLRLVRTTTPFERTA